RTQKLRSLPVCCWRVSQINDDTSDRLPSRTQPHLSAADFYPGAYRPGASIWYFNEPGLS
ncbi:hypothetical protein F2P79_025630, partial [Pimephales promelas]